MRFHEGKKFFMKCRITKAKAMDTPRNLPAYNSLPHSTDWWWGQLTRHEWWKSKKKPIRHASLGFWRRVSRLLCQAHDDSLQIVYDKALHDTFTAPQHWRQKIPRTALTIGSTLLTSNFLSAAHFARPPQTGNRTSLVNELSAQHPADKPPRFGRLTPKQFYAVINKLGKLSEQSTALPSLSQTQRSAYEGKTFLMTDSASKVFLPLLMMMKIISRWTLIIALICSSRIKTSRWNGKWDSSWCIRTRKKRARQSFVMLKA